MLIHEVINKLDSEVIYYNSLIKEYKATKDEALKDEINNKLDKLVIDFQSSVDFIKKER